MGAELFCVWREREREIEIEIDGLMDMKKLKIAFSNYTNSSNVQSLNTYLLTYLLHGAESLLKS